MGYEWDIGGTVAMNTNLLTTLKQLISQHGVEILDDPQRVKNFLSDYAAKEPKSECNILVNCLQYGFHAQDRKSVV
jgi:hypothetical protein